MQDTIASLHNAFHLALDTGETPGMADDESERWFLRAEGIARQLAAHPARGARELALKLDVLTVLGGDAMVDGTLRRSVAADVDRLAVAG